MQLEKHHKLLHATASVLYYFALVYGSLYPAHQWDSSIGGLAQLYGMPWPSCVTTTDIILNILIYLPLGFFTARLLPKRPLAGVFLAILLSAAISGALEYSQTYLPQRISSPLDILLNIAGGTLGALIASSLPRFQTQFQVQGALVEKYTLHLRAGRIRWLVVVLIATYYCFTSLLASSLDTAQLNINWVPFRFQLARPQQLLQLLEPFAIGLVLAYLLLSEQRHTATRVLVTGMLLAVVFTVLEWSRQSIGGQSPDITRVFIVLGTWFLTTAWLARSAIVLKQRADHQFAKLLLILSILALLVASATLLTCLLLPTDSRCHNHRYALPPLDLLPEPSLENFHYSHPRLPAPIPGEIEQISKFNPEYWKDHQTAASNSIPYSRILLAQARVDTTHLDSLYESLIKLEPTNLSAGDLQTLALAYDWLYSHWNDEQRSSLLNKVALGCSQQIVVIREKLQLSPYNAMLYNGHLQALMMSALATHGDTPDSSCMRFTADYWKHRVIPVWRQVMGEHGGWHETGGYVGIGIGKAVYQIPAMWRKATDEDFFKLLPGIEGFLDFSLFRTRPDGTSANESDVNFFDGKIPDAAPLAIEFEHAAAYSRSKPAPRPQPLSYPWGPLSRPSLYDAEAIQSIPVQKYFDGIGALFVRSSWKADATWLMFKAGNNYWSHTHLDQGSFAIFRGGPLIINSKGRPAKTGANNTLIQQERSNAYNLVAVTDGTNGASNVENGRRDVGQRQVGSGYGRPAPLDYPDWVRQQEHYRTIGKVLNGDDPRITWINVDLTPAYSTPSRNPLRKFSQESRIKHYQRSFAYLKASELIVVYDQVETNQPGLEQSWQLHSTYKPRLKKSSFQIETPARPQLDLDGGRLYGQVLIPQASSLQTSILSGTLPAAINRQSWRLDIKATEQRQRQEFLVVMRASSLSDNSGLPAIQLEQRENSLELRVEGEHGVVLSIPRKMAALKMDTQKTP